MKKIPNFSCERGGSLLGLQNHLKSRYYTLSLKDTLIIYRGTIKYRFIYAQDESSIIGGTLPLSPAL